MSQTPRFPLFLIFSLLLIPLALFLGQQAVRATVESGIHFFAPRQLFLSTSFTMGIIIFLAVRSIQRNEKGKPLAALAAMFGGGSILFMGLLSLMGK